VSDAQRLRFVQLDVGGTAGLDEGRYLAREPERVLVIRVANAPTPTRRRLRRSKPRDAEPEGRRPAVPLTTLTAIKPQPLGTEEDANRWLERCRAEPEARELELEWALQLVNAAVQAQREATLDPFLADVSAAHALAVRIGFGDGEALAEGRYERAIDLPGAERRPRTEALAPQETIAAVLGGRQALDACTGALLRARADLDAGRTRDAALQLRIGVAALLADRDRYGAANQAEDVAALEERSSAVRAAAEAALRGGLAPDRVAEVAETLKLCERVLRRRRAYG
jgi:hypothetical protein